MWNTWLTFLRYLLYDIWLISIFSYWTMIWISLSIQYFNYFNGINWQNILKISFFFLGTIVKEYINMALQKSRLLIIKDQLHRQHRAYCSKIHTLNLFNSPVIDNNWHTKGIISTRRPHFFSVHLNSHLNNLSFTLLIICAHFYFITWQHDYRFVDLYRYPTCIWFLSMTEKLSKSS